MNNYDANVNAMPVLDGNRRPLFYADINAIYKFNQSDKLHFH